ncbi:MAG TPA: 16S rRNA (adenine(1518)-N(6)/adenine(1519)-N(6))-dimethyltransferase RsmA [Leptolinea sp.]
MTTPPPEYYSLMKRFGIKPRKSLGQNFLLDQSILNQIVESAGVTPQDDVLEIGAGLGSLTFTLAGIARHVTAVELDASLIPVLNEVIHPCGNVDIIQGDILEIPIQNLPLQPGYLVVANIPYYITSAVIRHLLESPVKPARLLLTIQNEVAQRICAKPGDMSLLALSVQVYGSPSITRKLPAGAFYPPPSVDSACVRVDIHPQPLIPMDRLNTFFRLIKAGFSQKRKTLRNALSAGLALPVEKTAVLLNSAAIDPMRRAETLSIPEWEILVDHFLNRSKS